MSQRRTAWHGIFVPVVTPFTVTGEFDETACRQVLEQLIADGVHGIIVAGSTGEWFTLSNTERIRLFEVAKAQIRGRVTLLGGTAAIATHDAVALTQAARDLGMDGCMILPPPYVFPTERELLAHFEAVAAVGLPMMVYNNPPRTQVNLTASLAEKLAAFPSVVALKDSAKDLFQMSETISKVGDRLAVFCGIEPYALACLKRGAVGIVAMAPNIMGRRAVDLYTHAMEGRWAEACEVERIIDPLYRAFYAPGASAYVVIKECMKLVGRPAGWPRRPLLPLEEDKRAELKRLLKELGVL
jgi:4-hydroxy-tetrahydrodipicolinate synthase